MFDVILYTNKSERNKLNKDITRIETVSGSLTNESSLTDPTILIEAPLSTIVNCNYIHIPAFGRYYFVSDPVAVRTNLWRLKCERDVLMSWKNEILNQEAIVESQENLFNLLINDGSLQVYSNPNVITKSFPNGFSDNYDMVLAVLG